MDGLTFPDAWENRRESQLGGHTAWFVSLEDLIKNKLATGRPIDLFHAGQLSKFGRA